MWKLIVFSFIQNADENIWIEFLVLWNRLVWNERYFRICFFENRGDGWNDGLFSLVWIVAFAIWEAWHLHHPLPSQNWPVSVVVGTGYLPNPVFLFHSRDRKRVLGRLVYERNVVGLRQKKRIAGSHANSPYKWNRILASEVRQLSWLGAWSAWFSKRMSEIHSSEYTKFPFPWLTGDVSVKNVLMSMANEVPLISKEGIFERHCGLINY